MQYRRIAAAVALPFVLSLATPAARAQRMPRRSTPAVFSPAALNTLTPAERAAGWQLLFDGTDTKGWRNYRKTGVSPAWQVIDGALMRVADSAGDLITTRKYRNFDLRLDWVVGPRGNSGVMYRATEEYPEIYWSAPEMQILDDARHPDGKSPLTAAGSDYALYPTKLGVEHPAGQWNHARLVVNGNHVEHWLNGVKVVDYTLGSPDWVQRVAHSKFAHWPDYGKAAEGYIGLQDHESWVAFRNIRIRVLP